MSLRNYVSIRGQHLNRYSQSSGGGMTGGYRRESIDRCGSGQALVSISQAEWYNQDPEIREYLVDEAILDELEAVIRKTGMNHWNQKKFTSMFVYDGESTGYSFRFDKNTVSFSSQIYPSYYRNKLGQLDEVIQKYLAGAPQLPKLVNPYIGSHEGAVLTPGELHIYVYSYCSNILSLRVLNGLNEEVQIPGTFRIVRTENGETAAEGDKRYSCTVAPGSEEETDFTLTERLEAGFYKLILGEREIGFEIR